MSPMIQLLGTIAIHRPDRAVAQSATVATSKALDLLRLLVTAKEEHRTAEYYIGVLWPAADRERGRMSLRTALAQIRRDLGADAVRRSGDLLVLGEVDSDVARVRAAATAIAELERSGHHEEVLDVVHEVEEAHGADLVVSDSSCAEVYASREALRELRCQILLSGAEAAVRAGRARDSLELAARADDLVPTEASARAMMSGWAMLGETPRVVDVFERLCTRLDVAYGVEPSPATRALYLQVVTPDRRVTQESVEHHWDVAAQIVEAVMDLATGRPRGGIVWVQGEPGSGRAAVARHAVRMLRESAPFVAASVDVVPEFVGLDLEDIERVLHDATEHGTVLLIPVRRTAAWALSVQEVRVVVAPLTREEFRDLLHQLLQESPSPELEDRLWNMTGGLADHTAQVVGDLVARGQLRWSPGTVSLNRTRSLSHPPRRGAGTVGGQASA